MTKTPAQLEREIKASLAKLPGPHAPPSDAALLKRLEVRAHPTVPGKLYLEWFALPRELRGKGLGRRAYELWEAALPKRIKLIRLHAADSGSGPTDGFWEQMGFDWRYDFDDLIYSTDDPLYEASREMQKGIHGTKTPKPIPAHAPSYDE
jgi:GNAT superfamily N-acetyltransferase